MGAILGDIADALDLTRSTLFDWIGVQPCTSTSSGQKLNSLTWGGSWSGVTCNDDATNKEGGVTQLSLQSLGLTGSLHVAFRDLRTLRNMYLQNNLLQGTIPSVRGQRGRRFVRTACRLVSLYSSSHFTLRLTLPLACAPHPAVLGPAVLNHVVRDDRRLHAAVPDGSQLQSHSRKPPAGPPSHRRPAHRVDGPAVLPLRKLSHGACARHLVPYRQCASAACFWQCRHIDPEREAFSPAAQGTIPSTYSTLVNKVGLAFNPGASPEKRAALSRPAARVCRAATPPVLEAPLPSLPPCLLLGSGLYGRIPPGFSMLTCFLAWSNYATSLGLDRPIWNILNEIKLGLVPSPPFPADPASPRAHTGRRSSKPRAAPPHPSQDPGGTRIRWNMSSTRNPCTRTDYINNGLSPNYGTAALWYPAPGAFPGVTCVDSVRAAAQGLLRAIPPCALACSPRPSHAIARRPAPHAARAGGNRWPRRHCDARSLGPRPAGHAPPAAAGAADGHDDQPRPQRHLWVHPAVLGPERLLARDAVDARLRPAQRTLPAAEQARGASPAGARLHRRGAGADRVVGQRAER